MYNWPYSFVLKIFKITTQQVQQIAYKQKDFLFEINILFFITLIFPIQIEVKKVFKICIFEPRLFEYLSVKLEST